MTEQNRLIERLEANHKILIDPAGLFIVLPENIAPLLSEFESVLVDETNRNIRMELIAQLVDYCEHIDDNDPRRMPFIEMIYDATDGGKLTLQELSDTALESIYKFAGLSLDEYIRNPAVDQDTLDKMVADTLMSLRDVLLDLKASLEAEKESRQKSEKRSRRVNDDGFTLQ